MIRTIPSPEGLRPLPERPNLEFEEKRVEEYVNNRSGAITVEAARAACASEYGFRSWRNLVEYCAKATEHERTGGSPFNLEENRVQKEVAALLKECNSRKAMTEPPPDSAGHLAAIATYVPRFYGCTDEEISANTLTEAEARLVVARQRRHLSWKSLVDATAEQLPYRKRSRDELEAAQREMDSVATAVRECDLMTVSRWFAENSKGSGSAPSGVPLFGPVWDIIKQTINSSSPDSRALYDMLSTVGVDVQSYLNQGILGHQFAPVEATETRGLLALGANPKWLPPNGMSVLDHAIVRYMNGEAVDLIAVHVVPRQAFWIAAGLGDVDTMLEFVDDGGIPSEAARADRPDINTLGMAPHMTRAPRPYASDREIVWEAFVVATLNGRFAAADALLQRGFPIDYSPIWCNALCQSVQHQRIQTVEFLLSRGANPYYKTWPSHYSPIDMSKSGMENFSDKPNVKAIHALLTH